MTKNNRQSNTLLGFTLIELLVVTAIIIVLTAIGLVNFRSTNINSRNGRRKAQITQVRSALELYRASNSTYPIYSGSSRVTNFSSLISNSSFNTYLSDDTIVDPVNTSPYQYTYQSNASGFTYSVCYTSEPDSVQTCLTNP